MISIKKNPFETMEIPKEIVDAAILLDNFFSRQGCDDWQFMNICSRKTLLRTLEDAEHLAKFVDPFDADMYTYNMLCKYISEHRQNTH